MDVSKVTTAFKSVQKAMNRHSPEILTGIGIAGMITTTVMAVRATPKALKLIEKEKRVRNRLLRECAEQTGDENCRQIDSLGLADTIKVAWKPYIPATTIGIMSIFCLVGASSVNMRRNAALATAYTLSERAISEYREKVESEVGKKKASEIRDSIAQDKLDQKPINNTEVIITEKGDTLCFDVLTSRYFKSDIEKLRRIVNELNRRMRDENFISLNEFYYEIGLDGIKLGDDLGWDIDRGYIDLDFRSGLTNEGTPCLVVDYSLAPEYR